MNKEPDRNRLITLASLTERRKRRAQRVFNAEIAGTCGGERLTG